MNKGEGDVRMKAESRMRQPQPRTTRAAPVSWERQGRVFHWGPWRKHGPAGARLLVSTTGRQ